MKVSLRTKLSLSFLLVTVLLFAIVSVFANYFLEKQFRAYAVNKQEQQIQDTMALLSSRYSDWGNRWDAAGLESIGVNTLSEGLILRVHDSASVVIWDARIHNDGMCTAMLEHMAVNMQSYSPAFRGEYIEKNYPVVKSGVQVGSIDIGFYGPYFYSDNDLVFLGTLNRLLLMGAVISSLACFFVGAVLARRLTKPIVSVIRTTGQIARGEYGHRVMENSNTKEIVDLTTSINSLADTLGKQEALRKRLTSDVAHELRTPLATLQSHLEAMIDGVWQADADRLKSCHEETVRLSRLVGDLEKLTQCEDGNLRLMLSDIEMSALLKGVLFDFEGEFAKKNVALEIEGEPQVIQADADKIRQVFINLLSNALKYTPAGEKVDVRLAGFTDHVEISVADTGAGISEEDLPRVFERFYRTDSSRTRLTGGSGIGLTIAKAIVEAHHGRIEAISAPGKGSRFTVTLPRRAE